MKIKYAYKNILKLACLMIGLAISGAASAGLINGDFSNGFNGWSADYSYDDGVQVEFFVPVTNIGNFPVNFSTSANSVTLTPEFDNLSDNFGLYLSQVFQVAANSSVLSLNFDFNLTDNSQDDVYVTLVDSNFDVVHDFMIDGLSVDISSFAGSSVSLEFGVEDVDVVYGDYLTVSNISISQQSLPVPEPSSFALFAFALLMLRSRLVARK